MQGQHIPLKYWLPLAGLFIDTKGNPFFQKYDQLNELTALGYIFLQGTALSFVIIAADIGINRAMPYLQRLF